MMLLVMPTKDLGVRVLKRQLHQLLVKPKKRVMMNHQFKRKIRARNLKRRVRDWQNQMHQNRVYRRSQLTSSLSQVEVLILMTYLDLEILFRQISNRQPANQLRTFLTRWILDNHKSSSRITSSGNKTTYLVEMIMKRRIQVQDGQIWVHLGNQSRKSAIT
jgi:hypothetical protein